MINNLSIGKKIALGLTILFLFYITQSTIYFNSLREIDSSFGDLSSITKDTVSVLDIDKELLNLQRQTLVFGDTGSQSVYNQMVQNHIAIIDKINLLESVTSSDESKDLLTRMKNILSSYGESIVVLNEKFEVRNKLINEVLPSTFEEGRELLGRILKNSERDNKKYLQTYHNLQLWLEVNLNVISYLSTRRFKYKKKVLVSLEKIKRSQSNANLLEISNRYETNFGKAVQANRIFLSLVNVVMAGDAVEFEILSEKLRELNIKALQEITLKNNEIINLSEQSTQVIMVLFLLLLILITWFFNVSISKSIDGISLTFKKYLDGNFSEDVPGKERKDEIGQLAKAAEEFKNQNKDLIKSKEHAERSNKVKTEFLANMSHEIRTPMNAIQGAVELLSQTELSEEQRELLSSAKSSGDNLLTMLNDILDISKIESGKLDIETINFNLNLCIEEAISISKPASASKGISIVYQRYEEEKSWYKGDVTRIKQIVINFLSNAIKFSNEDVHIKVERKSLDGKNAKITISVIDKGIGIEKENHQKLFRPFSQADTSTTRKFGGTGLGLSICKKIADSLGGTITLDSELGRGTTITLNLELELGRKATELEVTPGEERNFSIKNPHNILIVEDNLVNQKIASLMLKKIGYESDVVENGVEALEALHKNFLKKGAERYTLIFMDIQMPEMDGIEATKKIISTYGNNHPPIVAMTANVYKEDKDECYEAGMQDFIEKPIGLENLKRVLSKFS